MIKGSIVALVTPMHEDGGLDRESLARLVEFHIAEGTDAIVAVGTTGESATLDEREHLRVIEQVIEQVAGRIPVIAGTGANSTSEAISWTRQAQQAGADACLLVTPYYNKPTQEGLYQHHRRIAEQVDIPQILYNVPGRTACDMLSATVARLAEIPNIIAVKEATGDLRRINEIKDLCGDKFGLYSGDDATTCDFCLRGGIGAISVTANVAPRQMHEMIMAAIAGDEVRAKQIDSRLAALHKKLFVESNPIPVKWAVREMGFIKPGIRLPMTWLSNMFEDDVRAAMNQAR